MFFSGNTLMASSGIKMPEMSPTEVYKSGGFTLTDTMVSAFLVTLILVAFAAIVRIFFIPKWRNRRTTSGFQMFLEGLVNMFTGNAKDLTGHYTNFVGPWFFATAAYICVGTLLEMVVPVRPPTSDLNFALMMGLTTFILIHFLGFKKNKAKRFLYYVNPLNVLSSAVLPFSLALRMFGSVFSGYLIMHLIYSLPFPVLYPAIGNIMFTMFHALIQSYIFIMLSMSFIGEAVE